MAGQRRGRGAEGDHEEGGHWRLVLGTPLRRRERERACASARVTRVGWEVQGHGFAEEHHGRGAEMSQWEKKRGMSG